MSDTAVINFISGCIQQGISFAHYGATADEIKDKTNALLAKYREWEAEEKIEVKSMSAPDTPKTMQEILLALYNYGYNNGRVEIHKKPEATIEETVANINALRFTDQKKAERHGRMNEHHIISDLFTNAELGAFSPATKRRLKARQEELRRSV